MCTTPCSRRSIGFFEDHERPPARKHCPEHRLDGRADRGRHGVQSLYLLVDVYFVAALGDAAVAGVSGAGTLVLIVMALTQVLGVGAVALIAQAVGRKDQAYANLVFNQSQLFSALGAKHGSACRISARCDRPDLTPSAKEPYPHSQLGPPIAS
jgi:hypothetical protein